MHFLQFFCVIVMSSYEIALIVDYIFDEQQRLATVLHFMTSGTPASSILNSNCRTNLEMDKIKSTFIRVFQCIFEVLLLLW